MKTHPLYRNGQWVTTDTTLTVVNPATIEPVAEVCTVDRAGVAEALEGAKAALPDWRGLTGTARAAYLNAVADEVEKRSADIAERITLENGKPLPQSKGEVGMTVDHLRWFAGEARRAYGRVIPAQAAGKRNLTVKTPVGVVGAISPWNFPLVLSVRKVAPALAAGCTVVLKPSSRTPMCNVALAECVEAAGLPQGVFQLVVGSAADIAQELLDNPICRKITFTGSTKVGKGLIQASADTMTQLSLELGGHAPVIVFDDADIDQAVVGAEIAKFRNTGQSCIAANRLYVHRSIYDGFLERFAARARLLKVGNGMDEGIEIGAMIDEDAVKTAQRHVEDAVTKGAKLLCGGEPLADMKGWFFPPTVLADVSEDALCMGEETFAPVAPVCPFDTEQEVIERANATEYGLSAYAFTRDLGRAFRLMDALEAGTIGINDGVPTVSQGPFGGVKQSGWGRELGIEGMDAFLDTKHISLGVE